MEFNFFKEMKEEYMETLHLAVNGTLMRGFPLNLNLLEVNAIFIEETKTSKHYRLWSINDEYPGMLRDEDNGDSITLEVWELSYEGLISVLLKEPPGLCIGKIELDNHDLVFGVLAEPYITEGQKEITKYGGWREYRKKSYNLQPGKNNGTT